MVQPIFQQLDHQPSAIGDISLRRRRYAQTGEQDVYEVKLGDEFLMSSLFVDAEVALANLGLEALSGDRLDVVVGGLGLGYTAHAALHSSRVASLRVVEYLQPVIDWHRQGLVPLGPKLTGDPRCTLVRGDFFALATEPGLAFDAERPDHRYDAILLDIDHTPDALLDPANARFYGPQGLRAMARQLKPDGVFGLWSDAAAGGFLDGMREVFQRVDDHEVVFHSPFTGGAVSNRVYIAQGIRHGGD